MDLRPMFFSIPRHLPHIQDKVYPFTLKFGLRWRAGRGAKAQVSNPTAPHDTMIPYRMPTHYRLQRRREIRSTLTSYRMAVTEIDETFGHAATVRAFCLVVKDSKRLIWHYIVHRKLNRSLLKGDLHLERNPIKGPWPSPPGPLYDPPRPSRSPPHQSR